MEVTLCLTRKDCPLIAVLYLKNHFIRTEHS